MALPVVPHVELCALLPGSLLTHSAPMVRAFFSNTLACLEERLHAEPGTGEGDRAASSKRRCAVDGTVFRSTDGQ